MGTRCQRHGVAPGVKRYRQLVLGGQSRDLFDLSYSATSRDVRLKEINGVPDDKILKSVTHVQIFTDGYWHIAARA